MDAKAIRRKLQLTQDEMATVLGTSPSGYRKWEQGARQPSGAARTLLRIMEREPEAVLRALAAAPPIKPPERVVTAMAVKLGDVAPLDDQIASVRALVEAHAATLATRDDGLLAATWTDASTAAKVALALRDALPATRIALASGKAGPAAAGRAVDRALALLAIGSERICVDDETAKLIEPKLTHRPPIGRSAFTSLHTVSKPAGRMSISQGVRTLSNAPAANGACSASPSTNESPGPAGASADSGRSTAWSAAVRGAMGNS